MKTLSNIKLIKNRINKIAAAPPKFPLKGRNNKRVEILLCNVFESFLRKLAPKHCEIVTKREAINHFGKLGFVGHRYISPELSEIVKANESDFASLDKSFDILAEFGA
jgi:hypothetical protein